MFKLISALTILLIVPTISSWPTKSQLTTRPISQSWIPVKGQSASGLSGIKTASHGGQESLQSQVPVAPALSSYAGQEAFQAPAQTSLAQAQAPALGVKSGNYAGQEALQSQTQAASAAAGVKTGIHASHDSFQAQSAPALGVKSSNYAGQEAFQAQAQTASVPALGVKSANYGHQEALQSQAQTAFHAGQESFQAQAQTQAVPALAGVKSSNLGSQEAMRLPVQSVASTQVAESAPIQAMGGVKTGFHAGQGAFQAQAQTQAVPATGEVKSSNVASQEAMPAPVQAIASTQVAESAPMQATVESQTVGQSSTSSKN